MKYYIIDNIIDDNISITMCNVTNGKIPTLIPWIILSKLCLVVKNNISTKFNIIDDRWMDG